MSVFLIATSLVTTLLIAPEKFKEGGEANGRALAYLAHKYLGERLRLALRRQHDSDPRLRRRLRHGRPAQPDSALSAALRHGAGMGARLAAAGAGLHGRRLCRHHPVSRQCGCAGRRLCHRRPGADDVGGLRGDDFGLEQPARWPFLAVALVFVYTTVLNIYERPEGIKIASFFIGAMIVTSMVSRALRSTELRIRAVELDAARQELLAEDDDQVIRIIARRPRPVETEEALDEVDRDVRYNHSLDSGEQLYFLEIERGDASEFEDTLRVTGERIGRHTVLRASSPVVANAIAALLIHLEKRTGKLPHGYFQWTEGNPIGNLLRFLILGEGDVAPIAHEVLRRAVPDEAHRPVVHVS